MNEQTTDNDQNYHEVQRGWWTWIIFAVILIQVGIPLAAPMPQAASIAMIVTAGVLTVLAFCFAKLTISDTGSSLRVQFGPLPLLGTEIQYDEIVEIERDRSTLIDGWGLHPVRGGWLWNVWGFNCIKVVTDKKTVRIGTQRPDELLDFLLLKTETYSSHSNF